MKEESITSSKKHWERLLGKNNLLLDQNVLDVFGKKNLGEFKARKILAILYPSNAEQVQKLVQFNISLKFPLTFSTISTGKNWGLGSFLPYQNNAVLINLSRMNQIIEYDHDLGIITIEPGVTQRQVFDYLKDTNYILNLTTSSEHTSIIGNALEKGVGVYRQRTKDILSFEVITGTGEQLKSGSFLSPKNNCSSSCYTNSLGPNLKDLFFQSNFGIITKATLKLINKQKKISLCKFSFSALELSNALTLLKSLYRSNYVDCVTRIYNSLSVANYNGSMQPKNDQDTNYCGYFCVKGEDEICEFIINIIDNKFRNTSCIKKHVFFDKKPSIPLELSLYGCYNGSPIYNDFMIKQSFNQEAKDLDQHSTMGWLTILPIIPFKANQVKEVITLINIFFQKKNLSYSHTLNVLDEYAIDLVIVLKFDRDRSQLAHQCVSDLYSLLSDCNIYPYRIDVDHTEYFYKKYSSEPYYEYLLQIKNIFDPSKIFDNKRYISSSS